MKNKRIEEVQEILLRKVKNNLDVLFDFTLSDKEFKDIYKVSKKELKSVI